MNHVLIYMLVHPCLHIHIPWCIHQVRQGPSLENLRGRRRNANKTIYHWMIITHRLYAFSHLMFKEIKLGRSFVSYQWWIACCMHKYLAITHHTSFTGYFLSRSLIKKLHTRILLMCLPGPFSGCLQWHYKPPICTLLRPSSISMTEFCFSSSWHII